MILLYTFVSMANLYIKTLNIKKGMKIFIGTLFILSILFLYYLIPGMIIMSLQNCSFRNTFDVSSGIPNRWTYYIPLLNMVYVYQLFVSSIGDTTFAFLTLSKMVPFLIETIAMIIILWFLMIKNVKEYLCT